MQDEPEQKPKPHPPRFLLSRSPLTDGGKARLMSGKKVKPGPAKPRPVSISEASGYTNEVHKALRSEPECLSAQEWEDHVSKRSKIVEEQQRKFENRQREEARRLLTFEERLTAAMVHARSAKWRADISSEVRLLRQMQQAGKEVRHLEKRLHVIERKVWREPDAA